MLKCLGTAGLRVWGFGFGGLTKGFTEGLGVQGYDGMGGKGSKV